MGHFYYLAELLGLLNKGVSALLSNSGFSLTKSGRGFPILFFSSASLAPEVAEVQDLNTF